MSHSQKGGTTRVERFKAFRAGAGAYRDGRSVGDLPYLGAEDGQAVLRGSWVTGYQYARREQARANAAAASRS